MKRDITTFIIFLISCQGFSAGIILRHKLARNPLIMDLMSFYLDGGVFFFVFEEKSGEAHP